MEKEKKTEVTVLKVKFGSYKSVGIGRIPRLLCSGGKELQHINLQKKKPNQNKKSQNLQLSCICKALIFTEGEHSAFGCARLHLSSSHYSHYPQTLQWDNV